MSDIVTLISSFDELYAKCNSDKRLSYRLVLMAEQLFNDFQERSYNCANYHDIFYRISQILLNFHQAGKCLSDLPKINLSPEKSFFLDTYQISQIDHPMLGTIIRVSKHSDNDAVSLELIRINLPDDRIVYELNKLEGSIKDCQDISSILYRISQGEGSNTDPNKKEDEPEICAICLVKSAETTVYPCAHHVVCHDCSEKLKGNNPHKGHCIYCRTKIVAVADEVTHGFRIIDEDEPIIVNNSSDDNSSNDESF